MPTPSPRCGNGLVDPGETCDTAIPAGAPGACPPPNCDDHVPCTKDMPSGSGCTAKCEHGVDQEIRERPARRRVLPGGRPLQPHGRHGRPGHGLLADVRRRRRGSERDLRHRHPARDGRRLPDRLSPRRRLRRRQAGVRQHLLGGVCPLPDRRADRQAAGRLLPTRRHQRRRQRLRRGVRQRRDRRERDVRRRHPARCHRAPARRAAPTTSLAPSTTSRTSAASRRASTSRSRPRSPAMAAACREATRRRTPTARPFAATASSNAARPATPRRHARRPARRHRPVRPVGLAVCGGSWSAVRMTVRPAAWSGRSRPAARPTSVARPAAPRTATAIARRCAAMASSSSLAARNVTSPSSARSRTIPAAARRRARIPTRAPRIA